MKFMVPVALLVCTALAGCGGTTSEDAAFKAAFVDQCDQQVRSKPGVPAGLDVRGACACAADRAFANKTGINAFAQTPEGQLAVAQQLAQCLQERAGSMAPPAAAQPIPVAPPVAAPPAADGPEPAEVEAEDEGEPVE